MIRLTRLPLPVSKNALHIPIKCGKFHKLVRSKKARLRAEEIVQEMHRQMGGKPRSPCFTRPVSLTWTMTPPDSRSRDVANYGEQLLDCLQEAGIVSNDRLVVHETHEMMPVAERPGWIDLEVREIP